MNIFKKFILFALVSMMMISAAACDTGKDSGSDNSQAVSDAAGKETIDYSGEYIETIAQRASITVTKSEKGYDVWIRWPDSVDVAVNWTFTGTFDDSGILTYTNCEKTIIKFDEDGNDTAKTEYSDGTGKLVFADNALTWQDDKEDAGSDYQFARQN